MDTDWWYQCCRCGHRRKLSLYDDRPDMNASLEQGQICDQCNGRGPFKKDGRAFSSDPVLPVPLLEATLEEIDAVEPWPTRNRFGEPEVRSSDIAFQFKNEARKELLALFRDRDSVLHRGKPSAVRAFLANMGVFKGHHGCARFVSPGWTAAMTSPPRRVSPESIGPYPRVVLVPAEIQKKYSLDSPYPFQSVWMIHCWNATDKHWQIETAPAFHQAVASMTEREIMLEKVMHARYPESEPLPVKTEEILTFGPESVSVALTPGTVVCVGDVLGWEVESQLEFTLRATDQENGQTVIQRFDLGSRWTGWVTLPSVGDGGVVTPLEIQTVANIPTHPLARLSWFRWGRK